MEVLHSRWHTHWELMLGARSHSFSQNQRIIRNHSICLSLGDYLYLSQSYNILYTYIG